MSIKLNKIQIANTNEINSNPQQTSFRGTTTPLSNDTVELSTRKKGMSNSAKIAPVLGAVGVIVGGILLHKHFSAKSATEAVQQTTKELSQEQTKCTENSKEKEAPVKNEDDFEFLEEDDYDPVKTEQELKQSIINNMQTNYNIKETTINHLNLSELTELQNFIFDLTQKLKTYKNALKNEDFDFERILGRAIFELESFNRAKVPESAKETALQVIMCNPKYKNLVRLFNGTKYQNIEQYKINNNKEHVAFTDSNIYAQELEKSGFDMAVLRDLDEDALGCVYYIVRKLDDAEFLHSKNIEADYLNIEPELNRLSENVLIAAIENLSTVPEYSVFSWEKC